MVTFLLCLQYFSVIFFSLVRTLHPPSAFSPKEYLVEFQLQGCDCRPQWGLTLCESSKSNFAQL